MAGTIIDMSKIKQLLQLKRAGITNRQIAKDLKMSRDKANKYSKLAENDPLGIDGLLKLDDSVLEKRLHPGNPAYSDGRMDTFLQLLPDFLEQLRHKHVTRQLVWEEYRQMYPDGYGRSQFFFHLAQNLKAQKSPTSALSHEPGKELFVDFAGDRLGYIDTLTGDLVRTQTFSAGLVQAERQGGESGADYLSQNNHCHCSICLKPYSPVLTHVLRNITTGPAT